MQIIQEQFPEHEQEFVVSVYTGMRLSEQFTVTWGQASLERRTIELSKTKNGSERTIRLGKEALSALLSLRCKGQKSRDRVWNRIGADYQTRTRFTSAVNAGEIEDYTWHNNRHTFCSWLAMAGATLRDIQELAGHKTISMSARYAHLSPEHSMSVLDRLGTWFPKTATHRPQKRTATSQNYCNS